MIRYLYRKHKGELNNKFPKIAPSYEVEEGQAEPTNGGHRSSPAAATQRTALIADQTLHRPKTISRQTPVGSSEGDEDQHRRYHEDSSCAICEGVALTLGHHTRETPRGNVREEAEGKKNPGVDGKVEQREVSLLAFPLALSFITNLVSSEICNVRHDATRTSCDEQEASTRKHPPKRGLEGMNYCNSHTECTGGIDCTRPDDGLVSTHRVCDQASRDTPEVAEHAEDRVQRCCRRGQLVELVLQVDFLRPCQCVVCQPLAKLNQQDHGNGELSDGSSIGDAVGSLAGFVRHLSVFGHQAVVKPLSPLEPGQATAATDES